MNRQHHDGHNSDTPLLLLFVIKGSALNRGMNTGIENLAWGLAEKGCNVHIISGGSKPNYHRYSIPKSVTYHFTNGNGYSEEFIQPFLSISKKIELDFVIGWIKNIASLTFIPGLSDRPRPTFIANQGSTDKPIQNDLIALLRRIKEGVLSIYRGYMRLIDALQYIINPISYYQMIDLVVANSKAVESNVREVYGIKPNRSKIIYRSVDTDLYSRDSERDVYLMSEPIPILYTGNITERKGIGDIVNALKHVTTPVKLTLSGKVEQEYILALREDLGESNVNHQLTFTGELLPENLLIQYRSSSIFTLCSYAEGFSKSLLEAMACGLPVIVSDLAPFKEIIKDHVNGLMVPVHSPKRIAEAIHEYIERPELRKKCGINARKTVQERFRKGIEVNSWLSLINEYPLSHK